MSWLGTHPFRSRAEARAMLPPGACKLCHYWYRCFYGTAYAAIWGGRQCSRCGFRFPGVPTSSRTP
jgi:hypothetical protein